MARRYRLTGRKPRTRRPRTGKKSRGKVRRRRTRRPRRMSKRFFMRGGGGSFFINLSSGTVTINSGLQNASGESIAVNIPPNSFHATIPTNVDRTETTLTINNKPIVFSVGKSERNIVIIDKDGNITTDKDNKSERYTEEKLKNGEFPNSKGEQVGIQLNKV